MALNYNPNDAVALVEGEYEAALTKVEERLTGPNSKNPGQEMEVWHVTIYGDDGKEHNLKEFVTAAAAFKISALANAVGDSAGFKAGTFDAKRHIGATFRVKTKNETTDEYGEQPRIKTFLPKRGASRPAAKPPEFAGITNAKPERTPPRGIPVAPTVGDAAFNPDDIPS